MNFTTAVRTCFQKYAVFTGTASRPEYWWFFLFYFVIDAVLFGTGLLLIRSLVALVMFLPSLAVGVRRMHDAGRSGWWILTTLIPPWGIYLLCTRSKTENNPYASGYTLSDANVASTSSRCESCGKMRLPGQTYCVGCGAKFPDA
ncbi:MAG: DUF805 domain-containing protein [Acidimicrobiales bacterium]|jgi:uncharacterized membrane protein YhaH (DUF805 family)